MEIVNLFAFRCTKPEDLTKYSKDYLIGEEGDKYILESVKSSSRIVLGWGNAIKELENVKNFGRDKEVAELLQSRGYDLYCADLTAKKCPKHPLYIPSESKFFKINFKINMFEQV